MEKKAKNVAKKTKGGFRLKKGRKEEWQWQFKKEPNKTGPANALERLKDG